MMIKQVLLLFSFASGLALSVSESKSAPLLPQAADQSFSVGYIQMKNAANCSYMVVITTSCSSAQFTTDEISIVFGDGYGNQIYAPNLENPISKTFERCSSDAFQIDGPCASQICYAYLYRSGAESADDGWKPESVKIYGFDTEGVTFNFNTSIPRDTWYGYNFCDTPSAPPPPPPTPSHPHPPTPSFPTPPPPPTPSSHPPPLPPSSSYQLFTPKWFICVVLGFVCILWL